MTKIVDMTGVVEGDSSSLGSISQLYDNVLLT